MLIKQYNVGLGYLFLQLGQMFGKPENHISTFENIQIYEQFMTVIRLIYKLTSDIQTIWNGLTYITKVLLTCKRMNHIYMIFMLELQHFCHILNCHVSV